MLLIITICAVLIVIFLATISVSLSGIENTLMEIQEGASRKPHVTRKH
jgi:hypothetical protein